MYLGLYFSLIYRNQLCHQYEKVAVYTIASDEEDAKYLAKRKMLGNIKFIGELGKLQIIQDFILHRYNYLLFILTIKPHP